MLEIRDSVAIVVSASMLTIVTGCSTCIYGSGRYSDVLRYDVERSVIHAKIGKPLVSGRIDLPEPSLESGLREYDVFKVSGKIPDADRRAGSGIAFPMTLGLSEFIAVPKATIHHLQNQVGAKLLKVIYVNGRYRWHHVFEEEELSTNGGI